MYLLLNNAHTSSQSCVELCNVIRHLTSKTKESLVIHHQHKLTIFCLLNFMLECAYQKIELDKGKRIFILMFSPFFSAFPKQFLQLQHVGNNIKFLISFTRNFFNTSFCNFENAICSQLCVEYVFLFEKNLSYLLLNVNQRKQPRILFLKYSVQIFSFQAITSRNE